jgi:Matrixin
MRFTAPLVALALCVASPLFGYVLEGQSWTKDRTVVMQLSLGTENVQFGFGGATLQDGFTSFNESAEDALNVWNQYLTHLKFAAVRNSPVTPVEGDDEMSVLFSDTIFGDMFGTGTLAVTVLNYRGSVMEETDTVVNTFYSWDSYRGPFQPGAYDFHRVIMHEFGHTLGLDHPDEHGQHVTALMNSKVGAVDTVQPDDIAGVQALYGDGPPYQTSNPAPNLVNISTRASIDTGDNVLIGGFIIQGSQPATVVLRAIGFSLASAGIGGALSDPFIELHDSTGAIVASSDDWFTDPDAETIASYNLDPPNSRESALIMTLNPGSYTAIVKSFSDVDQPPAPGIGLFELYDLHLSNSRAGNISTRGQVLTGTNVMIGGFIIGDNVPKTVVVRAIGPSLANAGVVNPLSDPFLELHDGQGNLVASNDDWQQDPSALLIQAEGLAPSSPKESATQQVLNPGNYTAIVSGVNGVTGLGLVEVYDLAPAPP